MPGCASSCSGSQVDFPAPVGALNNTCGAQSRAVSNSGKTAATGNDDTKRSRGLTFFAPHCSIAVIHNRVPHMSEPQRLFFAIDLPDRKSTRLNSSHVSISYAVFCLKKKKEQNIQYTDNYPLM